VVVEQLIEGEAIPKIRVRTLAVPARCTNCGVIRQASIDPAGIREARRQGLQPESECRRCSGSIPIMLPDAIVAYFEGDSANSFSLRGSSSLSARLMLGIAGAGLAIAIVVMLVILLT
jgi:hypothetical protein